MDNKNNNIFIGFLAQWHKAIGSGDPSQIGSLLADDVVFYSPVVHTPQRGKYITMMYLAGAGQVLKDGFEYQQKIIQGREAAMVFTCKIEDIEVEGIDIIELNEEGLITSFKVMIRPLKAVHKVHEQMGKLLEANKVKTQKRES